MSELSDFLRRKKEEMKQQNNKEEILQEWLNALENFMSQIKIWLSDAQEEGLQIIEEKVEIAEEKLGKYKAPALILRFHQYTIYIEPAGRFVIGGRGRVDIRNSWVRYKIIRKGPDEEWFLFPEKKDREIEKFDKELFTEFIKKLMT